MEFPVIGIIKCVHLITE